MLMTSKLKACPFCGGFARVAKNPIEMRDYYVAHCTNSECAIRTPTIVADTKEAARRWNRRAKEKGDE